MSLARSPRLLDAVMHLAENRVYVNVPKLVVGKMPWADLPTAGDTQAKLGPPAGQVTGLYGRHSPTGSTTGGR